MKVILKSDVFKMGRKGEVKDIADGYATNFLIPRGLAELATVAKIKEAELLKKEQDVHKEIQHELLEKNLSALKNISIEITEKVNEQGHLYEGVRKEAILKALNEQAHIKLHNEHVLLEQPIKSAGEHTIKVMVDGKEGSFMLQIKAL